MTTARRSATIKWRTLDISSKWIIASDRTPTLKHPAEVAELRRLAHVVTFP